MIKWQYIAVIVILVLIFFWIGVSLSERVDNDKVTDYLLSLGAISVALITAIIALAVADQTNLIITFEGYLQLNKIKNKGEYQKGDLSESLRNHFESYSDPLFSYQVYFNFKNTSNFTLKSPTITLRLPDEFKHPDNLRTSLTFNSNMHGGTSQPQLLEFGNTTIISNSNLPYLNKGTPIRIWVRMCLGDHMLTDRSIRVSLNAEKGDSSDMKIKVKGSELLKGEKIHFQ